MRRVLALTLALGAVLPAASPQAAEPIRARLVGSPAPSVAGEPWTATLTVLRGRVPVTGARPLVVARSGISWESARARRVAGRGRFRATLRLPFEGRWRLEARLHGRRLALGAVRVAPARPLPSPLRGFDSYRICDGARNPLPQYALSQDAGRLWVGCRERGRILRLHAGSGRTDASIRAAPVAAYSLAAGAGAVWTANRSSVVWRTDPATGRTAPAFSVASESPYLWVAAGSVWAVDEGPRELVRFDPGSRRVVARVGVGDGASALVEHDGLIWVVTHRDGGLYRIDPATNDATALGRLPGDAPERMAHFDGSLWVTGRGTDVLRVDPATGAVQATIEIGAGAIDLGIAGGSIWVAVPTAENDGQGLPLLDRLVRIDPQRNQAVGELRPTEPTAVNGIVSDGTGLWIADTVNGRLLGLRGTATLALSAGAPVTARLVGAPRTLTADSENLRIRKVDLRTGIVTAVVGS